MKSWGAGRKRRAKSLEQLKRSGLPTVRIPRVARGYSRRFVKCKECGRVYFYDYVPFSLSTPILTTACGHGMAVRDYNLKDITESQYRTARAREIAKARAA